MTMEKDFMDALNGAALEIGLSLSDHESRLFCRYRRELLLWNSKMSLVSLKSPLDLPIKHCIDSLLPARFIEKLEGSLLDIGTGAGFPGIPLKIILPSLFVTLIDASRKKTSFLRELTTKLRLERINIIQGRIEQLATDPHYAGTFDMVISRAAFRLSDYLEIGAPFLKPGGSILAMQSQGIQTEWSDAMATADKVGLTLSNCHDLRLPVLGDLRKIIIFTKY